MSVVIKEGNGCRCPRHGSLKGADYSQQDPAPCGCAWVWESGQLIAVPSLRASVRAADVDLAARRHALGLTQADLAARLGVPVNTLARWERGELSIRHAEILSLAMEAIEKARKPS